MNKGGESEKNIFREQILQNTLELQEVEVQESVAAALFAYILWINTVKVMIMAIEIDISVCCRDGV